mgnify:CR=1 FL=1
MNNRLWELLEKIPSGKVVSYSYLANRLQTSPRVIGRWLHKNTNPDKYPCHRVVRKDGSLASGYAFGGEYAQRKLLEREGITFDKKGKIDSRSFI